MSRPYVYDRTKVRIGWWNSVGRSDTCARCGKTIKKTCNLRITAEDGTAIWAEFGVDCATQIIERYPAPRFEQKPA